MPWFKVDDKLHMHAKWLAASDAARALWVTAGSWCAANEKQEGVVPRHVLPALRGKPSAAAELVQRGLWDEHPDGWLFHDWLEFQPSAAQVDAARGAARERQRRARERAAESRDKSPRASQASHGVSHGPPDPTRPDPLGIGSVGQSTRAVPPPGADAPELHPEPTLEPAAAAPHLAAARAAAAPPRGAP